MSVPAGQSYLALDYNNPYGTKLYVKYGDVATTTDYDCMSFHQEVLNRDNYQEEKCVFMDPQAGRWYVTVRADRSSSGLPAQSLIANHSADPLEQLTNGIPRYGLSEAWGSLRFFKITVPAGRSTLDVSFSHGPSRIGSARTNVEMYVSHGVLPDITQSPQGTYACEQYSISTAERRCTFTNPAAGDWYVIIESEYYAYRDMTLYAVSY